jgi:hypothetical protein
MWGEGEGERNLPSIAQGHHAVDVDVTGGSPCRIVVGTVPAAARACARRVGHHVCAIALEDCLARVARPGLRDPVGEQVAGVAGLRALRGDGEAGKLGAGVGCGGDVGRGARAAWSYQDI